MGRLVFLIAIGIFVFLGWRLFQELTPGQRRQTIWRFAAGTVGVVLLLLVATGRLYWLSALLAASIPILRQLFPLALRALPTFAQWHLHRNSRSERAHDRSRVTTDTLNMSLDHETGAIDGEVSLGPYQGRRLSELNKMELLTLHRYCTEHDADSTSLLASYLDQRLGSDWREQEESPGGTPASGDMSPEEALAILGLHSGAGRDDILAAHRQLIQKLHPDRGGNDYLAAKINRARDLLLS